MGNVTAYEEPKRIEESTRSQEGGWEERKGWRNGYFRTFIPQVSGEGDFKIAPFRSSIFWFPGRL